MYKCKYCYREFENRQQLGGHIKTIHSKFSNKGNRYTRITVIKQCPKCNNNFTVTRKINKQGNQIVHPKERKFCSRKCANSHIITKEQKEKTSNSMPNKGKSKYKQKYCKICNKKISYNNKSGYCQKHYNQSSHRRKASRIGGIKSASLQYKRSKNEIYFANLCQNYFSKVLCNAIIFNGWDADVIIEDYRIAVLWNGPWHYRKITRRHSVKQVQTRDKIKIDEIIKCGYVPYIIKDDGKCNKEFVEKQFRLLEERVTEMK